MRQNLVWKLFAVLFVSVAPYCAWADVPPLEVDGLRSVLIRGRVVVPLIPPPAASDLDTALPNSELGEAAVPVPPRMAPGRELEPTPADPRRMQRPAAPIKPVPARRPADGNPHRLASMELNSPEDNQAKGRDTEREDPRPRLGIFRRRR